MKAPDKVSKMKETAATSKVKLKSFNVHEEEKGSLNLS